MIDWLARQCLAAFHHVSLFVTNPTGSAWIAGAQVGAIVLGAAWLVRIVVLTLRGRRYAADALREGPDWERLALLFGGLAPRALRLAGTPALRSRLRRLFDEPILEVSRAGGVVLCTVGFLRPRIVVSRQSVAALSDAELEAALAHELAHVLHRDNARRAVAEALAWLSPALLWVAAAPQLAASSLWTVGAWFYGGLALGLAALRVLLPILRYRQERRCDEWAAALVGDRLVVARALLNLVRQSSGVPPVGSMPAAASPFGFLESQVSRRVRHLLAEPRQRTTWWERWTRPVAPWMPLATLALVLVVVARAASLEPQWGELRTSPALRGEATGAVHRQPAPAEVPLTSVCLTDDDGDASCRTNLAGCEATLRAILQRCARAIGRGGSRVSLSCEGSAIALGGFQPGSAGACSPSTERPAATDRRASAAHRAATAHDPDRAP